ncbi:hypothetical protein NCS55_00796700 [Fusarium keratoplasticum]|nr:hypothetical protein NCS55_00796700 [Fusarium keratoplasticum]
MPVIHVEIDPDGDTLIILPHQSEDEEENDEEPDAEMPDVEEPSQSCFKVSMKHLVLASPRAKKMFEGNYAEAQPGTDGLRRWTFEPIFDAKAFRIVMNAIHGHTRKMPRTMTLRRLAKISAIVDDLDCSQSLWFYAKTWLAELDTYMDDDNFRRWMLISFVFDEPELFESATTFAIRRGDRPFDACGLPIRPKIIDTIDAERDKHITRIVDGVASLIEEVKTKECDPQCKSMTFGALTLYLISANLVLPSPSKPYLDLRLSRICHQLNDFRLPLAYRPGESFKKSWKRSKDLWVFQEAPLRVSDPSPPQGVNSHSCDLRGLVTRSLSSLSAAPWGLNISDFR